MMMADCEANYARLCRVMPSIIRQDSTNGLSKDTLTLDIDLATNKPAKLTLSISERCRFTTMVNLQVLIDSFSNIKGQAGCVNMSVRLYHDVNMAEVIACNHKPNRLASYEYPNELMFQPDEKAQQNRFLSEWLGLCLKHGMSSDCISSSLAKSTSSELPPNQQSISQTANTLLVGGRTLRT